MGVAGDGVADAHRPRTKRVVLIALLAVVLLALAASGWLVMRVLNAKSALEQAESLARTMAVQVADNDRTALPVAAAEFTELSATAVEQTADPLWRVAEFVPVLGPNLSAVRAIAESIDLIAQDAIAPLGAVAGALSFDVLKPVDGGINLEPLNELARIAGPAAAAFHSAANRLAAVDFEQTMPQLEAAGGSMKDRLAQAIPVADTLSTALELAPGLLGGAEPRSYLLVFQNLTEAAALGGTVAAVTEVNVVNGSIDVGRQASSHGFGRDPSSPVLPADPGAAAIFGADMYTTLALATSRPDFPTAATLVSAFWQRDEGGTPDGVISVDPVALSYILSATGPVTMSTGELLTAENAVELLQSGIYTRFPGVDGLARADAFFAEATRAVVERLTHAGATTGALGAAVMQGIEENRIVAWSAHRVEQLAIAGTQLGGILPSDNAVASATGIFFRDRSVSKIDYYVQTFAALETDVCTAASPTFTTSVSLQSALTQEQADALPVYVTGGVGDGGKFRTQVFVYGPPGTTLASSAITGGGDEESSVGDAGMDLGRPVATFWVTLGPGESVDVQAVFTGPAGEYAPPTLRTTPMLTPTTTTVTAAGCPAA